MNKLTLGSRTVLERSRALSISLILWALPTLSYAAQWPHFEAPPAASVKWVAQDIVHNGVPMKIKSFQSRASSEEVVQFYRQRWGDDGEGKFVEQTVGPWKVIGTVKEVYNLTVQVQTGADGSASEGFLGISTLPSVDRPVGPARDFPQLGGSQLISETISHDSGQGANTLIIQNDYSVGANVSFYSSRLPTMGWTQRQNHNASDNSIDGHVLYFERAGKACHIVITRGTQGNTFVVVNSLSTNL